MWLADFEKSDVATLIPHDPMPVTESGKEDVSSTDLMCFSCHDGWTLDSREMWKEGNHNHPVGVEPSERVVLPTKDGEEIFPLNEDGKLYCGTCHTAHRVDWEDETGVFMSVRNPGSEICLYCHKKKTTGVKEGNHPVLEHPREMPLSLLAQGAKFSKEKGIICESCHNAHGAKANDLLVVNNKEGALCTACHADQGQLVGSKHDLTITSPKARTSAGEFIAESGPCSSCHQTHHAKGASLSPLAAGKSVDKLLGGCTHCHKKGGLAAKTQTGRHSHPVGVSVDKLAIDATAQNWIYGGGKGGARRDLKPLPLFTKAGVRAAKGGKIGCLTCHDPHSRPGGGLKDGDKRTSAKTAASSFLRMDNRRRSALCLNCHLEQASVVSTQHNLAISVSDKKEKNRLRVAQDGPCSGCHGAHNGKGPFVWSAPGQVNKESGSEFCLSCHTEKGLAGKHVVGQYSHPTDVPLKRGMKTKLPLAKVKGEKQMVCSTCHDPHRWSPGGGRAVDQENGVKEGDVDNSFLRLAASGESPLCAECHRSQGLVADTEHDLRITAPKAINHNKRSVRQTGVCGQCHSVHNADEAFGLWARGRWRSKDFMAEMCLDCHREDGVAKRKIPQKSDHPDRVTHWSDDIRRAAGKRVITEFPVFDRKGNRRRTGIISCLSCHDPHRWNANKRAKGPGRNTEGTVLNSFLRFGKTASFACADCHGLDSIYRYKFFHSKASRIDHPLYR
ncbi:MAG: cytochrome c3 family protein [Candidatus Thiodiazotropha sp.]